VVHFSDVGQSSDRERRLDQRSGPVGSLSSSIHLSLGRTLKRRTLYMGALPLDLHIVWNVNCKKIRYSYMRKMLIRAPIGFIYGPCSILAIVWAYFRLPELKEMSSLRSRDCSRLRSKAARESHSQHYLSSLLQHYIHFPPFLPSPLLYSMYYK
jgi:hypothetical protein